jgi:CBS domain-containing protein
MHMTTVGDVMTRDVVTVGPRTPFKDTVDLIIDDCIRAVPGVDAHGALLGVVSAADLLCRQEHQDDEDGAAPHIRGAPGPRAWRKASYQTAAEVMTSPVLTVAVEAFLPSAARLLVQARGAGCS